MVTWESIIYKATLIIMMMTQKKKTMLTVSMITSGKWKAKHDKNWNVENS